MTARTAEHSRSFVIWIWDWAKSIVVALVVWFFLRTFLVEAFRIPSGSMENTLLIGDFLFVNKATSQRTGPLAPSALRLSCAGLALPGGRAMAAPLPMPSIRTSA